MPSRDRCPEVEGGNRRHVWGLDGRCVWCHRRPLGDGGDVDPDDPE